MIQKLTDIYPLILQRVKGVPRPVLLQHLQDSYRIFCADTEAWRPKITTNLVEDQRSYKLNATYNAMIKRIVTVWFRRETDVTNDLEGGVQDEDNYRFYPPNELKFEYGCTGKENVTSGLVVRVVLIPEVGTSDVDPDFLNEWHEGVFQGALASLKSMEGKAWSAPREGEAHNRQFRGIINRALADIPRDHRNSNPGFEA